MPGFRKLAETEDLRGPLVTVATARFESPGGEAFERQIVHHPGAVVVVPMLGADTALLVRQYRAAVGSELLELPAGKRDVHGEAPEMTASRELAEEVGQEPGELRLLARFYNSPGFSDELSWLYLAKDLRPVADSRQGLEERYMTIEEVRLESVPGRVERGEILDAKTIIGLMLAMHALWAP